MKELKYRKKGPVVLLVLSSLLLIGISVGTKDSYSKDFLQTQEQKRNEKIKNFQEITKKDLEQMIDSIGTHNYYGESDESSLIAKKDSKGTSKSSSKAKKSSSKKSNSKATSSKSTTKGSKLKGTLKYAKKTSKKSSKKPITPVIDPVKNKKAMEDLNYIKLSRSRGLMSDAASWQALGKIDVKDLKDNEGAEFLQFKALLLYKIGYYVLSAIHAAGAIEKSDFSVDASVKTSWEILYKVSVGRSIQTVLLDLAEKMGEANKFPTETTLPPYFGKSWYYYVGSFYYSKSDYDKAIRFFSKLSPEDKLYVPGSYSLGIIYVVKNDNKKAEKFFQNVLNLKSQKYTKLSSYSLNEINNYTKLALARIFYQEKRFKDSIKFYKSVDKESSAFYKALSEQAWAFFMIGYTNHALGALYGAKSPFFKDIYNPELDILESIVYYWMCRYQDSKNALADFIEKYVASSEELKRFLSKTKLNSKIGYDLFENYLSGVDVEYLGVPREILSSVYITDSIKLLRYEYSYVLEEISKIKTLGIYGVTTKSEELQTLQTRFQNSIGDEVIKELKNFEKSYDEFSKQAQYLYIELLMSERSQLLGKELHTQKFDKKYGKDFFTKKNAQSWNGSDKEEYWWDEVGFYKLNLDPQCQTAVNKK